MAEVLVLVEHVDGAVKKVTLELLTKARQLGEASAVFLGGPGQYAGGDAAARLAEFGATKVYVGEAAELADREGVEIRTYSVIYRAIDELRDAMQGMLAPEEVEETVGQAEVRAIFRASRIGTIAGCYVTEGRIVRGARCRLVRDGTIVYEGTIGSLRRGSDDVREVATGFECGIVLRNYQDLKQGDVLEVFETKQVERTLE